MDDESPESHPAGPETEPSEFDPAEPDPAGSDPTESNPTSSGEVSVTGGEGAPELEAETPGTSLVDRVTTRGPLVQRPLPRSALARNRLVAGFPTVLRPASGSRVHSSSVSAASPRLQVALVASTRRSPDAVLRNYRQRFTTWGLVEGAEAVALAGSQAARFVLDQSTVTVTVREVGGGQTTYQVFATLHTGQ